MKIKRDYSAIDAAILAHVAGQTDPARSIHPIRAQALLTMAREALGIDAAAKTDDDWRLIDRRLQALRKAGKIELVRRCWRIAA